MQLPSSTSSSLTHIDYAVYHLGACEAWKDVEIITQDQRAVIAEVITLVAPRADELRARTTAAEQAEEGTSRARARFGVRDVVLDFRVNAASDGLLNGPAQRSRDSALYRTTFLGGTASDITGARPREEPELAKRVRDQLAAGPSFPARDGLVAELGEAITKSVDARDALDAAEDSENQAGDAEITARLALRRALEQSYGKLRAAFPGQRDFVESFFPKRKARGESAAGERKKEQ